MLEMEAEASSQQPDGSTGSPPSPVKGTDNSSPATLLDQSDFPSAKTKVVATHQDGLSSPVDEIGVGTDKVNETDKYGLCAGDQPQADCADADASVAVGDGPQGDSCNTSVAGGDLQLQDPETGMDNGDVATQDGPPCFSQDLDKGNQDDPPCSVQDHKQGVINQDGPTRSIQGPEADIVSAESHKMSQECIQDTPVSGATTLPLDPSAGISVEVPRVKEDLEGEECAVELRKPRNSKSEGTDLHVEDTPSTHRNVSVVLADGVSLQGESDVDLGIARTTDSASKEELGSSRGLLTADISSSISTDKTFTSSPLSTSSLEEDSVASPDALDATFVSVIHQPASGDRSVLQASVSGEGDNSGERDADRTEGKAGDTVGGAVDAAGDMAASQTEIENEASVPEDGAGNTDANAHSGSNNHNPDSNPQNSVTSHEPFAPWVDTSRLLSNLGSQARRRGEQSGNTQEQELRSLLGNVEDSTSWKRLKKLLRSGTWAADSTVRKVAWLLICSNLHKLEKAYVFLQMEKEMFGDDEDVPVHVWPQQPPGEDHLLAEYYLTPQGKNTAHKILAVIGQLSPDITYSPGLLPMVDLFLHYMEAADCFSCVLTLLQSRTLVYLMQSRVAFEASKRVMRDLTKKYAKSAYVSLVRSCSNVDSVFDNWMGWIYSDLPFRYVVAVTDSYLMEGIKVLYRVALAILTLFTKHSGHALRGSTGVNVSQSISQFCQTLPVPPARLLKMAFKIRGFSRKKISKLQSLHEGQITSGAVSHRSDMPRVASSQSMGEVSTAVSTTVSMAVPNTKMMGFHDTGTNILSVDQLATIWSWLPPRHAINPPKLLFNSAVLGTSLMTLYAHVELDPCTIFIIKTVEGEVFGAFCADAWYERRTYSRPIRFFGTGETFLFTLVPERVRYEWVGKPNPHVPLSANMFQAGDNSSLMIGGGNGSGIILDGMMERCRTETCDTFNNPPLCPSMDFVPAAVEVFGFQ